MDRKHIRIILLIASLFLLALIASCDIGDKASSDEEQHGTLIEKGELSSEQYTDIDTDENDEKSGEQKKSDDKESKTESKTPLKKFEYSWSGSAMPDIVIIVDDFGNSTSLLEDFAKLPSEVVFAVLPDLGATKRSGEVGAQYGHEVIIHLPMDAGPKNRNTVGKRYVKMDSTREEIAELLRDFKRQLPMAIAANNHMGSYATKDRNLMEDVLKEIHAQGLFFMDSMTTNAVTPSVARTLGYPALKRDIFLDVDDKHKPNSEASINAKIEYLGRYKGRREPVIIITHCHNREKLNALQDFITKIQAAGLKLTTLSAARRLAA